jgi:hypothetical protein
MQNISMKGFRGDFFSVYDFKALFCSYYFIGFAITFPLIED